MQDVIRVFESLCNISSLYTSHRLKEGLVGNSILFERMNINEHVSKPVKLISMCYVYFVQAVSLKTLKNPVM